MKFKKYMLLLVAVLLAFRLGGCSMKETKRKINSLENNVEQKLEKAEDKIEGVATPNKGNTENNITKIAIEKAQETALNHAGFTDEQVTGLHIDYEVDDGIPQYDVKFRHEYMEYEYEIHAETGKILSFDMDE